MMSERGKTRTSGSVRAKSVHRNNGHCHAGLASPFRARKRESPAYQEHLAKPLPGQARPSRFAANVSA